MNREQRDADSETWKKPSAFGRGLFLLYNENHAIVAWFN